MTTPNDLPSVGTELPEHWVTIELMHLSQRDLNRVKGYAAAYAGQYCAALVSERDELASRVRELEANARRYEWLRRPDAPFDVWTDDPDGFIAHSETLDAAIDAALSATTPESKP